VFTSAPLSLPAAQFGLGHGSGAHAPDEYFVIDSSNRRVMGLTGAVMGYIDFMYEMAR
jgi:acetylornithine deacetylase/succinyl-diaminopimelate desuccinylase-like protein